MISGILERLGGNRLMARVIRSSSFIMMGYGASQAFRLISNVILARLLFPEAFGVMALITVVTVGLMLFSDVGISPSIAQSKRGDDPDFLDTAWSIQIIRGLLLWGAAWALAYPFAWFYDEPLLLQYLPIAGISLALAGLNPTRIETAHRHLLMGRLTLLDVGSQLIGIIAMIALAWWLQSVAALVIGGVIGAAAKLLLTHFFLPGQRNRLRWERTSVRELITFGKWIFLSTVCWFFASQGDKLILGSFLSTYTLGIYNIGFFLASFPVLLGLAVTSRVMIPVYRETADGPKTKVVKMRYGLTSGLMSLLIVMVLIGPWLVDLLYDDRYISSGAILVCIGVALMPQVIGMTYDQAALAAGDSRRFFIYSASRSALQVGFLLIGALYAGLIGGLIGMGVSMILAHIVLIWLARAHNVWDARHDAGFALLALATGATALWVHWQAIVDMAAATSG